MENGLLEGSHVKSQKGKESTVSDVEANFYKKTQWTWVKVDIVKVLGASYLLEKKSG